MEPTKEDLAKYAQFQYLRTLGGFDHEQELMFRKLQLWRALLTDIQEDVLRQYCDQVCNDMEYPKCTTES